MKLPPGARAINLRDHPLQRDHRWDTPEFKAAYPDYLIMDVTAHIASDKGIRADFKNLEPLPFVHDARLDDTVLFVAGSSHAVKSWSTSNWRELSRRLGHNVKLIGEPQKSPSVRELIASGLPHHETPTFADLLSAVSSALLVVSIDTGPMHLAIHQGTPTVGLYLNDPFYRRREQNAFAVIAPRCTPECFDKAMAEPLNLDVEWDSWAPLSNWQCDQPGELRCMEQVSVEQVLHTVTQALNLRDAHKVNAGVTAGR